MPKLSKYSLKIGDTSGYLTLLECPTKINRKVKVKCKCVCGKIKKAYVYGFIFKTTTSCGCKGILNPAKHFTIKTVWHRLKNGCKRGNRLVKCNIEEKDIVDFIFKPCYYCGEFNNLSMKDDRGKKLLPHCGIDRVNPLIGYEKSNIIQCCHKCNTAKLDLTKEEFLILINKIATKHPRNI